MDNKKNYFKRIDSFLRADTWTSFIVTLFLAFILIKFIFFPGLSLITGTSLPLVIVESCSMYHQEAGFEKTFSSPIYEEKGLTLEDTKNWIFPNGFSKGDIIFVVGAKKVSIGDVIIFNGGSSNPIIHRLISKGNSYYSTKGDNYLTNSNQLPSEKRIDKSNVLGKALFKIPFVGWIKLIFFEMGRPPYERGLC